MNYCPQCKSQLTIRLIDKVEYQACSAADCHYVVWDNPVPVVAGVVIYREQMVLAQNVQWPNKLFSIITGYLDKHELPEQAVIREVREELGLYGEVESFIGHYMFKHKNQLMIAYSVMASGELVLGDEIAQSRLYTREQLAQWIKTSPLELSIQIVKDFLANMAKPIELR